MSDTKLILLIDGNDKDRLYYAHQLKLSSSGYTILEAATGQTGLELYKSQPVDCVILELSLPDVSGFEVLTELVPITWRPQIPVVVLTRFNNEALLKVAKMDGAFVTLQKDNTSGDELDKVIHNAIATIPVNGGKTVAAAPSNSTLNLD
jgi:DNA-binding NarL/FixJ family response regulator